MKSSHSVEISQTEEGYKLHTSTGGPVKVLLEFSHLVRFLEGYFGEKLYDGVS